MFSIRKTSLVLSAALGLAALSTVASDALAADPVTAELDVSATIAANCTIRTTPIAFGAYDPLFDNLSADKDQTGTVTVHCTNGLTVGVTLGEGLSPFTGSSDAVPLRQMASGATNRLKYFLYSDSGRTTVWGNDDTADVERTGTGIEDPLTVWGRIPAGQNVPAGTYNDTVIATVTF